MFKQFPKIFTHISSLENNNYSTGDYILNLNNNEVNLFHRYCPHRMYPLIEPGNLTNNIVCKFHNFQWDKNGTPINNNRKLKCGVADIGKSRLVFKDYYEPDHQWVNDLKNEVNLKYSHTLKGSSPASWLWMMDIQTDLLHIHKNGIHPGLSTTIDLSDVKLDQGEDWIIQTHSNGWWLCIYPFTFIEYSPGCLGINSTIPNDVNNEFGFTWITQFYYDPAVSKNIRDEFETLEDVFKEDVAAIEKIKGPYFPIVNPVNQYEKHCEHWGKWIKANKLK